LPGSGEGAEDFVSFQCQYDACDLKVKILTSGKERKVISESASSSIDESKKFVITFASIIQQEIVRIISTVQTVRLKMLLPFKRNVHLCEFELLALELFLICNNSMPINAYALIILKSILIRYRLESLTTLVKMYIL